jgi:hypothetical protein
MEPVGDSPSFKGLHNLDDFWWLKSKSEAGRYASVAFGTNRLVFKRESSRRYPRAYQFVGTTDIVLWGRIEERENRRSPSWI